MSNYTGISPTIFDEPEYRDQAELNIAIYLIVKSDMIGICPIIIGHVAKACRTSPAKVRHTLLYFEQIGKLKISEQKVPSRRSYPLAFGTHVCWYSKAYHSLRKGKASVKQQSMVSQLLVKWKLTGIFGDNFTNAFTQLYATKYSLDFSENLHRLSEYEDETEYKSKTEYKSEAESELTSADKPPKPHFENLRNLYIKICIGFRKPEEVRDWSSKRIGHVNARWKKHPDLDWWRIYFERVAASNYLRDGTDKWNGADFGWIMLPSNMENILEGRYDKKEKKRALLTSEKDYGPPGGRPF